MTSLTYLVTGANRGLGLEFCRQLKDAGQRVIATVRKPSEHPVLAEKVDRLEALDVGDTSSVRALADSLGEESIDVLINNAGKGGMGQGILDLDLEEVEQFFNINSVGPLRVVQALMPCLSRGESRRIVQISSRMGSVAHNVEGGAYGYRASKTALNMLNMSLSRELGAKGFICVVLHPGWVKTDMGGENAPVETEASVAGMLRVITRLSSGDNGCFYDYTGEEVLW